MKMKPPFQITPKILALLSQLTKIIGKLEGYYVTRPNVTLRRQNQIRTIHSSLAIEGNTMSLSQVTAIIDNKRVVGPAQDILEVKNAIELYETDNNFDFRSIKDFLKAHKILMRGLVKSAGSFRSGNVGIFKGTKVAHVAPKAARVAQLMTQLFDFLNMERELPLPVVSAIFHYESEFIHPFDDGNGRMGRFWQHLILTAYDPLFSMVPFESVIYARQDEYYRCLAACDRAGESTLFIEYSLDTLIQALASFYDDFHPKPFKPEDRLELAKEHFAADEFSRKDYLLLFRDLSTATASRDLLLGVERQVLTKTGDKAQTQYRFRFGS